MYQPAARFAGSAIVLTGLPGFRSLICNVAARNVSGPDPAALSAVTLANGPDSEAKSVIGAADGSVVVPALATIQCSVTVPPGCQSVCRLVSTQQETRNCS